MEKFQELQEWKDRLRELIPDIMKQIDWMQAGTVKASVNSSCPEKLRELAGRLVEIQNKNGEYQRNQISKSDIERIKYYSKQNNLSFENVINLAVANNRYISKNAIEARGVAGFITEIQSVYDKYYEKLGVFPINAMNAEVKRACRNFKTDVSLKDKVEAIVDVFFPEMKGVDIVDRDSRVVERQTINLTSQEIIDLIAYFNSKAIDGKIDACFKEENQKEFLEKTSILEKANKSVSDFLSTYTNLTYSKCYSVQPVPAVVQMLKSYMNRYGTTRQITTQDPYLRHKIEVVQKITGKYSMLDLINFLHINGDNTREGRSTLSESEITSRSKALLFKLELFYPDKHIEEDFIKLHPEEYEELKLISSRCGFKTMDDYLNSNGFTRAASHTRRAEDVFYISEQDFNYYKFYAMDSHNYKALELTELNPVDYIGVYNKLIALGLDSSQFKQVNGAYYGE